MRAILFVDDHEVLARTTCKVLQMHGYRAEYVGDGMAALARFEQEKFDMVVTDYCMEGMDGIELAKRIREQAPELPIIVISGCAAPDSCDGISAWVVKQDMFPNLLTEIRRLLKEPETAEKLRSA